MKTRTPTSKTFGCLKALLAGMFASQVLATLQVRQSNLDLHANMREVLAAGYLPVPCGHALSSLASAGSAFWGGVFFTLSIGAILTLATIAAARLFPGPAPHSRRWLYAPVTLWALVLVAINLNGFEPYTNLYFLVIPPVVYFADRPGLKPAFDLRQIAVLALPVVILAALWLSQYDRHMFTDIRDRLLLSNPVGREINRFYYRYTLYPAEAFKSLSQKMIRTSRVDAAVEGGRRRALEEILTRRDWLPVPGSRPVDLAVTSRRSRLVLAHGGRDILTLAPGDLASRPGPVLERFSERADRHGLLRALSFHGLLFGFPILLYAGLYGLFRTLFGLAAGRAKASTAASAACLVIGVAVWGFFVHGRIDPVAAGNAPAALASENWRAQVAALRRFAEAGLDITQMPGYDSLKNSRRVAVRYWLVRALSASRHPRAGRDLLDYLDDPSLNVRTQACEALAGRNARQAIPELLRRLKSSDQWYFQWYAYRALKTLGWSQVGSD